MHTDHTSLQLYRVALKKRPKLRSYNGAYTLWR